MSKSTKSVQDYRERQAAAGGTVLYTPIDAAATQAIEAITFKLYWISADGSSSLDMGTFRTEREADDAIPSARKELLDQGCTDEGEWVIEMSTEDLMEGV